MMQLGLERIQSLLNSLNNPQDKLKVIHVGGTNGKGSVIAYISSILIASGYKTGTYNSPHFLHVHDGIRIQNQPLERIEFERFRQKVVNTGIQASPFEIMTATALLIFNEMNVDIAVIEVGMGGRLDATNVFSSPLICVFTSIGLDHTEFLGDTVEKIALEKSGIIKLNTKAVVASSLNSKSVLSVLESQTTSHTSFYGAPMATLDSNSCINQTYPIASVQVFNQIVSFPLVLKGEYQLANASVALYAIKLLDALDIRFKIKDDCIQKGFESVVWRGRLDVFHLENGRNVIVDGAHNEPAALELRKFISDYTTKESTICWIVAFTSTKDFSGILTHLLNEKDTLIATQFSQPEEMPWISPSDPKVIESKFSNRKTFIDSCLENAMKRAMELDCNTIVVCGSLYLVADYYRLYS